MLGADEAGKGPVLGPMVAGAVRADPAAIPDDVDDSKRLSPARREELAAELAESEGVATATASVPVARIDDPETDMNGLTVAAQAAALATLATAGERAVVDAGDVSEERFARRVHEALAAEADGLDVPVTAAHGADATYPVVAAASVVAKVERDRAVEALDARYRERGFDGIGSGYPSDPATRSFLRAYVEREGELPACARTSWSTCADLLAAHEQSALEEF